MTADRKKLINAMLDKGMNNKELSRASGVSISRVSNIKNGQHTAYGTLCKIAKALEVPAKELIDFGDCKE